MVPLQERDQKAEDAHHETDDDRNDRQGVGSSRKTLTLQDQQGNNDKGKNSHEPKARHDAQDPWKPLAFLCSFD